MDTIDIFFFFKQLIFFSYYPIALDFAHSQNGYVYHTKYDKADTIPIGTYAHTGRNILALTRALANAPELNDLEVN